VFYVIMFPVMFMFSVTYILCKFASKFV